MNIAPTSTALRMLLVEDDAADAELLLQHFRHGGYEVSCSRVDTAEGMQSALVQGPWDVVIADYSLPGFGALPALSILQSSGQDLPFIIVSGVVGEETAVAAMKAGAHDFVLKSRLERLVPALERELKDAEARREHRRVDAERQRLIVELQSALAKVKALSGLIPICAWCKKIRSDEGYWQELESYVSAHLDTQFSHGICPECRKSRFPSLTASKQ
jgi:DNA-binding NtrC family response regulator